MSRYTFRPIDLAPRDGRSLVLADDTGWQAVGHFSEGVWWLGHRDQPLGVEELEFEPTRFSFALAALSGDPQPLGVETRSGPQTGKLRDQTS